MANLIQFFILMAIVWYSIETRRLANLTQKQIKINIRPLICIINIDGQIKLKNIGKSAALNIAIDKVINRQSRDSKGQIYNFEFDKRTVLAPQEDCILEITPHLIKGTLTDPNVSPFLAPNNPNFIGRYKLKINYTDIEDEKWQSIFEVDQNNLLFRGIKEI
ncbi:MAG: hypothetical protein ISS45_01585 [Candidatus Omnitrophica bacterium]|nr:hypothetical protein [Candidatus Omnitrophota bacterium]